MVDWDVKPQNKQLTNVVISKTVRRRGPVNVRQLQQFVMDEWSRNRITEHMSEVCGDAESLSACHLNKWSSYRVLRGQRFPVTLVFRIDVIKRNAGYRIAHYVNIFVLIKFSQKTVVFTLMIISSP